VSYQTTTPNDFAILWQIPQYMIITAGEIMFSITTLSFAFTEVKMLIHRFSDINFSSFVYFRLLHP